MKVAVIGAGKLGLPMAVVYASKGHDVTCVDNNEGLVARLQHKECPYREPQLAEYLRETAAVFTTDYDAVRNAEIIFVIVPTPSDATGRFSNRYIEDVLRKLGDVKSLVVIVSTVMPNTMFYLQKRYGLKLAYNPEFIAIGSVIRNMLHPDTVLIGGSDTELLVNFTQTIIPANTPIHCMSFENAELAKLSLNCFVTTKIAFANQLARLCEEIPSGNVDEIVRFLGDDSRIGGKYLVSGMGFGGPCFPRDNEAMLAMFSSKMAEATIKTNADQVHHVEAMAVSLVGHVAYSTISVLGLTYKTDTSVVEQSQAIKLVRSLALRYRVRVYDPWGLEEAHKALKNGMTYCDSLEECLKGSNLAIIATPWQEFRRLDLNGMVNKKVLDCWRILENKQDCDEYRAVGISAL